MKRKKNHSTVTLIASFFFKYLVTSEHSKNNMAIDKHEHRNHKAMCLLKRSDVKISRAKRTRTIVSACEHIDEQ